MRERARESKKREKKPIKNSFYFYNETVCFY